MKEEEMRKSGMYCTLFIFIFLLFLVPFDSYAQNDMVGRLGIGVYEGMQNPVGIIRDRLTYAYEPGIQVRYGWTKNFTLEFTTGLVFFRMSDRATEKAYSWLKYYDESRFGNATTPEEIATLEAENLAIAEDIEMDMNLYVPFTMTVLYNISPEKRFKPYMGFGMGLYSYDYERRGPDEDHLPPKGHGAQGPTRFQKLSFPGWEKMKDWKVAWGFQGKLGFEYFVNSAVSVNLTTNYQLILGELRPMEWIGLENTLPLQFINVLFGAMYYF